ncbi:hypothetical protein OPQ81_002856 [Rhizoctonia solani]|nr:hypothetical protein OPQ81_002856 [Rhizoctonia solani]
MTPQDRVIGGNLPLDADFATNPHINAGFHPGTLSRGPQIKRGFSHTNNPHFWVSHLILSTIHPFLPLCTPPLPY